MASVHPDSPDPDNASPDAVGAGVVSPPDHSQNGNGWVIESDGSRQWGRFGAAGLLVRAPGAADDAARVGEPVVLLQLRSLFSHQGGTWSIPGGARDSHESPAQAALREANEETGLLAAAVTVLASIETARTAAGWTYTTVIGDIADLPELTPNEESDELRWVPVTEVDSLPLHAGFASAWPTLRDALTGL